MASGATVKLGVEGISQFKNNMNQAKQAVKTLDAQLSLSEKQFKQTGDAESYMAEKTELLKAKLEQQKQIVDNAQKALDDMASRGVDRASKAYQDMYRQMVTAKGAMIDTENQLNGVADSGDKAADGVSEMNAQLKRVGDGVNFQQVTTGLGKITDGLEKAAKKAINLGKQIVNTMVSAGSWADDLHTRATYFGLSDEELQRMEKTATLIDTPVEAIISAQKKLRKGIGSADQGVMGAFAALFGEGYDPNKTGWDQAFWDAGEALMKFTDEEEKEVYAQKLFGRSWNELIPLFEAGREEYEKTNESWKVVSQESIDALGKMDDEYQRLMADWEAFKYEALAQFAEPMEQAFTAAQGALGKFMDYLKSEDGQQLINNVVNSLQKAIEWISKPENIQAAIKGLKDIFIGWGLLKLVGGGLQALNLINGIKGLTASAAASAGANAGASWAGAFASAAMKAAPFLAFLYETLHPAGTAGNDIDTIYDENGNLTTAGREAMEKNGGSLFFDRNDPKYSAPGVNTIDLTPRGWGPEPKAPNADLNARGYGTLWEFEHMQKATEDLLGASDTQKQSSTEMAEAAGTMKGLPGVIESAILAGMGKIKVYIDGQQAGGILTPYVNSVMAGVLTGIVKP